MAVTDPIADLLTRIRNAIKARKKFVDIPFSNMKESIIKITQEYHFVNGYSIIEVDNHKMIRVILKYVNGESSISGLKRISTPGLRKYSGKDELPRVLNGLGVAVISTPKGIMSDKNARKEAVGGEVICHIW